MYVLICQTPLPKKNYMDIDRKGNFPPELRACWIKLNSTFQKNLQTLGLTPDQFTALRWINELNDEPLCQKNLAQLMFTDSNNISGLIRRMEKLKLITRERDTKDKRKKIIKITYKGNKIFPEAKKIATTLENNILSQLNTVESKKLILFLQQICTKLC